MLVIFTVGFKRYLKMALSPSCSERRLLSALILLIISLAFVIFHKYLTFDNLYLFKDIGSDTVNSLLPRIVHVADYLRSEGIPEWSFNQGMGQNIFAKSLGNPFAWILYLLGRNYLAYGIAYVEVLKILLGGIFFYLYLYTLYYT